jgi:hypothetical protein
MAVTQFGTTLMNGAGTLSLTNYIVVGDTDNSGELDRVIVEGGDGKAETDIQFRKDLTRELTLLCLPSAAPATDFPKGGRTVIGGVTYCVEGYSFPRAKGEIRVSVQLRAYDGIDF